MGAELVEAVAVVVVVVDVMVVDVVVVDPVDGDADVVDAVEEDAELVVVDDGTIAGAAVVADADVVGDPVVDAVGEIVMEDGGASLVVVVSLFESEVIGGAVAGSAGPAVAGVSPGGESRSGFGVDVTDWASRSSIVDTADGELTVGPSTSSSREIPTVSSDGSPPG